MTEETRSPRLDMEYRLQAVEQYLRNHGETLTAHNTELNEIKTERAVGAERALHIDQRFDRIEKQLDAIRGLGKWALGTFGAVLLALIANFLFRGGFNGP